MVTFDVTQRRNPEHLIAPNSGGVPSSPIFKSGWLQISNPSLTKQEGNVPSSAILFFNPVWRQPVGSSDAGTVSDQDSQELPLPSNLSGLVELYTWFYLVILVLINLNKILALALLISTHQSDD